MTLADKIVVLKGGEVMQIGAPMELFHNPANLFVAGFLGAPSMNFLSVRVEDVQGSEARVASDVMAPVTVPTRGRSFEHGQTATLGIRPPIPPPRPGRRFAGVGDHRRTPRK